jgi:hypothetical protein
MPHQYGSHSYPALNEHHLPEELFKFAIVNPGRAVTRFFPYVDEPVGARNSQLENFTACCLASFYLLAPR